MVRRYLLISSWSLCLDTFELSDVACIGASELILELFPLFLFLVFSWCSRPKNVVGFNWHRFFRKHTLYVKTHIVTWLSWSCCTKWNFLLSWKFDLNIFFFLITHRPRGSLEFQIDFFKLKITIIFNVINWWIDDIWFYKMIAAADKFLVAISGSSAWKWES